MEELFQLVLKSGIGHLEGDEIDRFIAALDDEDRVTVEKAKDYLVGHPSCRTMEKLIYSLPMETTLPAKWQTMQKLYVIRAYMYHETSTLWDHVVLGHPPDFGLSGKDWREWWEKKGKKAMKNLGIEKDEGF
jgi:hypothetical protein